jgi:preprotein translocase subunit SecG
MERSRGILTVAFLLFIVVLSVFAAWRDGSGDGEKSGREPATKEEIIREKTDNWVPMAP